MNNSVHISAEILLVLILTAFSAWAISGIISRLPMRGRITEVLQWITVWILEIIGAFAGLFSCLSVIFVSFITWHLPWYVVAVPLGFVYVGVMEGVQMWGKARFEIRSKRFSHIITGQTPPKPLNA